MGKQARPRRERGGRRGRGAGGGGVPRRGTNRAGATRGRSFCSRGASASERMRVREREDKKEEREGEARSKMRTRDREIEGPGAAWTPRPDSQILGGPASCRQAIDSRFPRLWSATQRPPKPPAPRRRGRTTHRCSTQSLLADARRSHNERLTSGRLLHPRCPGLAALGRSVVAAVPLGP